MDTVTLTRLALSDHKIKYKFGGVFASDMLPQQKKHYRSFIVNTDPTQCKDRKRFIDDLEDDDFPPMTGKTPAKATNSKKHRKFNLNLAESENDKKYQPYSINLGRGFVMELKEFRNAHYLGFVKFGDGNEVRNRFNIPIDQLTVLKKAIEAIENHIDSH
ncbi:hypothetical protein TNCV_3590161 [Trichonephila clavipes]|nr:hypothetical protein TNCV_3590161 [Trichonephila clavipes]